MKKVSGSGNLDRGTRGITGTLRFVQVYNVNILKINK